MNLSKSLKIVSRKSLLALWQANFVKEKLLQLSPYLEISIIGVSTEGDRILDVPLNKIGGKGLFVKELEDVLLKKQADIAVHSMKDVPAVLPEGLMIGAILERENPCDVFVSKQYESLEDMPKNAVIGTSSLRRQAQVLALRPDLKIKSLRGNVDTRLRKLEQGEYDAIILAYAGLQRLGFQKKIRQIFKPEEMLPGIGQGALGIECRREDEDILNLIQALEDPITAACVNAERSMNALLQGGCESPIAGLATLTNDFPKQLILRGLVAELDGSLILTAEKQGGLNEAAEIGEHVARALKLKGADKIITNAQKNTFD